MRPARKDQAPTDSREADLPDAGHGEALFDGLLDYPLPQRSGVRDYVFHFVPADPPGYGSAARFFFQTFYPDHVAHDVGSLEGLIRVLHDDVTQNGVQQIREVAIVAHGSPIGLSIRLVDATDDEDLLALDPLKLSELQDRFQTGALPTFAAQRAVVLDHFSPDAFVTLRVCRFGQSDEGLYAVYSFFGGGVDVYAPLKYQFFGSVFMQPGARFRDRLAFHDHLVRQRYVPAGRHTPARATALVRAMEHEQSFSDPFDLAAMSTGGGEPPEYGALIDALNAAQLSPALRAAFEQHGFALSPDAKAYVDVRDAAWRVRDIIKQDQEAFPVEYGVGEEVDLGQGQRKLVAQGTVVGDGAEVSLQVFLDDSENADLKGQIATLAYRLDGDPADAPNVERFEALSALLAANGASGSTFTMGALDLREVIAGVGEEFAPADTATIVLARDIELPKSGLHLMTWLIAPTVAGPPLEIQLNHPFTNQRVRAHTLVLARHFAVDEHGVSLDRAAWEAGVLATTGTNSDSPGVELAASLDRLGLDDLVDLITFLQGSYDPARVIQLHHAHEALGRKAGFRDWMAQRTPTDTSVPLPAADPLTELSLGQRDDLAERFYAFTFDDTWREVRESVTPRPHFQHDLFLEESLLDRFPNVLATWADIEPDDDDSPASSAKDARPPGQQRFSTTTIEKDTFTPPDVAVGCEEYRAAIRRIKELKDLPVDQLSAALAAEKTPGGKSYFDIAKDVADKYGTLQKLWALSELNDILKLPDIPSDRYEFGKFALKWGSRAVGWETGMAIAEVLEADTVVLIPLAMWMEVLDTQQEGVEKHEAVGRLTGVRTWLRELDDRAARTPHVLDTVTIDLTGYTDQQVLDAYVAELDDGQHTRFMLYIEDFHRGFTEGAKLMQERWPDLRRDAEEIVSRALQDANEDSCRTAVLVDEGVLDLDELRALVIRQIVGKLLGKLRRV